MPRLLFLMKCLKFIIKKQLTDMLQEEKVKNYSLKKYPCKRNKGDHEYNKPVILYEPQVRYIYKCNDGTLDTDELLLEPEGKLIKTEITVATKTTCKHCGKKAITFFREKII
jgi:hypothetical protein